MPDRLTGIEVFVRAARLGGLSAAARELGMSPQMAARHLDALEARLRATLLVRTTRRVSTTEAGEDFLERAEAMLGDLAEAEAEASSRTAVAAGLLRVSAPAAFGTLYLAPLVAAFHRLHPGVTIELGLNDRFVDLLEERWDMAIRVGRLADSGLVARKLAPARLCVCAAPAYLAARGTPRRLVDLASHDCLGYTLSEATGAARWSFARGERAPVRGPLLADNGLVLAQAAAAGLGLAYVPRFLVAAELAEGRLVEVALDAQPMEVGGVHAVTHRARRPAAKTRAWINFLADRLRALGQGW